VAACRERLQETGLAAELHEGEMDTLPFPDGFFDGVVAFNSIYHGTAPEVDRGVNLVRKKLRDGGEFFATFLARDNRLYGRGERIAEHTYCDPRMYKDLLQGDGEMGVTHHFSSEDEVRHFFREFELDCLEHEELRLALPGKNGGAPSWLPIPKSYFWQVVARKVDSDAG
jgi:SAM-dependent methyltransferase